MELRLGNQQRHSITAVLLSAVVVIFGLVLVDVLSNADPDPLGGSTRAVDVPPTSSDSGVSESNDDLTAGVARSNARFTLNPDVTISAAQSTTTAAPRRITTAAVVTTSRSATTAPTTTTTTPTTSTTEQPSTSASSITSSTTETTAVSPPPRPSTTVVDDGTTTTRKCRGKNPGCRNP